MMATPKGGGDVGGEGEGSGEEGNNVEEVTEEGAGGVRVVM